MKKIAIIGGGASGLCGSNCSRKDEPAGTDPDIRKERQRRQKNPCNRKREMQPDKQRYERLLFPQRQSFRCRRSITEIRL